MVEDREIQVEIRKQDAWEHERWRMSTQMFGLYIFIKLKIYHLYPQYLYYFLWLSHQSSLFLRKCLCYGINRKHNHTIGKKIL